MPVVSYLVKPELEVRKVKDDERVPVICSEYYRDVDDYDRVLRAHCRLSDE
jgi:hypothetical protein